MSDTTCIVVGDGATYSGAQGFDYFEGISAESAGARGLCMHLLIIPPGGAARPHPNEQESVVLLDDRGARLAAGARKD